MAAHTPAPRQPTRPPLTAHRPQNTLVSNRNEGDELRRHISTPGAHPDAVEMDLEEIEDFDRPPPGGFVAGGLANSTVAEPVLHPETADATEVEVPIDIEAPPGTTRISLNIKLLLNLRRR
jgi:hypothetical protein